MTDGFFHGVGDAVLCAILIVGIVHSVRYAILGVGYVCRTVRTFFDMKRLVADMTGTVKEQKEAMAQMERRISELQSRLHHAQRSPWRSTGNGDR